VRRLAFAIGILLALPAIPLSLLSVTTPVSGVGFLYVLGTLIAIGGLVTAPRRVTRRRGVTRVGLAVVVLGMLIRIAFAGRGTTIAMTRGGSGAPLLDRLLPEGDVALASARAVIWAGMLPANDTKNLIPTLRRSFRTMDDAEGSYSSPIAMTSLRLQRKEAFDTIEIAAPAADTHAAVLFLHGFGGNFTLQCWRVAQAARRANAATFCPSTRLAGDWWSGDGRHVVGEMLTKLRALGFDRIVLAGLSNGGVGASRIAPSLRHEIVGLLLISGAAPDAGPPGVPAIAFEGAHDTMMTPSAVRRYADHGGVTYVELEGTHFLLIEKPDEMTERMGAWLVARFARSTASN
jgi:pimeloyl-ACP methyl ester carboxylesterase